MSGELPVLQGPALQADCTRCAGLCCIVPSFSASADFAFSKAAGQPCRNLGPGFRCRVHDDLRGRGLRGCAVYDCFGAGQQVCQVTLAGQDPRQRDTARLLDAVFPVMRQLHELLWYLTTALELPAIRRPDARPLAGQLTEASRQLIELTGAEPSVLLELEVGEIWTQAGILLRRTSELARAGLDGPDYAGADLAQARLRGADLTGASLRGAILIAADLGQASLRQADLTGADLRDADLSGADLAEGLFVTQAQLDAARGDAATALPPGRHRPAHWA